MALVQNRLLWFIQASFVGMGVLVLRLCWVSIALRSKAKIALEYSMERRVLLDAQGKVLAHSLPSFALAANPKKIMNVKDIGSSYWKFNLNIFLLDLLYLSTIINSQSF
ncbi:hypothetical protein [Holospora undulata]|nr:hypothetical protein [Holospora undulata]